jgi:hypothetical protein
MERVEHSEYILIKAFTDSEWDNCDFAVIHATDEWKKIVKERIEKASLFKDDSKFFYLSYWGSPKDFYKDGENKEQGADELLDGDEWCFIALEEGELEKLSLPENSLGAYQMIVYQEGSIYYKAYGEHSGEEFYTADFTIGDLLATVII